jgi:hypothetical protein
VYKALITTLTFTVLIITGCSKEKEPVIKLGKEFDKTKLEVTQETDSFTTNDNFAYSLSYELPFGVSTINRRIYKGEKYIDLLLKESFDIKVQPDAKTTGDAFPVKDIVGKFGSGNYWLMFVVDDMVIAKKQFLIQGNEQGTIKTRETKADNEIMPDRSNRNPEHQLDSMNGARQPGDAPIQKRIETNAVNQSESTPPEEMMQKKPARNLVSPGEIMGNE